MTDQADSKLIEELIARYTGDVPPPCRVCGGELSVQQCGGDEPTLWGCDGMEPNPDRPGCVRFAAGRSCADDHYSESMWKQYRGGDSDVIELCRRLRAANRELDDLHEAFGDAWSTLYVNFPRDRCVRIGSAVFTAAEHGSIAKAFVAAVRDSMERQVEGAPEDHDGDIDDA